jgi:hypothetical protein
MPGAGNGTTLGIIAGGGTIGVALAPIDEGEIVGAGVITDEGEIVGAGVITDGDKIVGAEVITDWGERSGVDVGIRVQAVRAIEPIPINNLKYFTLNSINIDLE